MCSEAAPACSGLDWVDREAPRVIGRGGDCGMSSEVAPACPGLN